MNTCRHLAIIMDGNGRWAKAHGKVRTQGHIVGTDNVRNIALAANKEGIEVMTVYAFSTENWSRSAEEVGFLMKLPAVFFDKFMKELMENNIRITMMGEMEGVPADTAEVLQRAIDQTSGNTGMILNFAFNYGGQREIVLAAKKYARDVMEGKAELNITEKDFSRYLLCPDIPPVDLMIRTSGEQRISNFMLWELAYAEMIFVEESWPEFNEESLRRCLDAFRDRDRRYGGVKQ